MKNREFIVKLATYYREPLMVDGKPSIRLSVIDSWITKQRFSEADLDVMLDEIILGFTPTGINPFPLIPHIIEICEIETTDKNKLELARTVADDIIWAVLNIGCEDAGCKERAKEHIGYLGTCIVKKLYGKWYLTCNCIRNESIEVVRSHLRDSILAYINRSEKGIEDKPAELEDLKVCSYRTGEVTRIGDIVKKNALSYQESELK
jgi:hypothetical protein